MFRWSFSSFIFLEILQLFLERHGLTPLAFWILPSANLLPQPTLDLNQTQTRAPCEAGALVLALPTMFWMKKKINGTNGKLTEHSKINGTILKWKIKKDQRMSRSTEVPRRYSANCWAGRCSADRIMRPRYRHLNFQKSQKFLQFWANFGTFFFKMSFWSNTIKILQKMVFLRFFSSWRWFLLIFEQFLIN